jgi:rare lipoprotein A
LTVKNVQTSELARRDAPARGRRESHRCEVYLVLFLAFGLCTAVNDAGPGVAHAAERQATPWAKPSLDRSGRTRVGKASFYADRFAGRTMADGTPMSPYGDNAASKTLPLGTKALVTNLETGRTARVTIRDRGPYVKGRIVDLSPSTARRIGIDRKEGVAMVEVTPIVVPAPK